MSLKRFMPVARGTRPAYRIKTRGELVFGDTRNIAPRRCAGTYTHVYGATRIRIGVNPQAILDMTSGLALKTMINQASLNSAALRQANVARAALLPRVLRCSPRYSPAAIQIFFATR